MYPITLQRFHASRIKDGAKSKMCTQSSGKMVKTKIYKKQSPSGGVTLYLSKREYISCEGKLDNIHGIVFVPSLDKVKNKVVFASLNVTFRYGREEDEMMGLSMKKEINMDRVIVHPSKSEVPKNTVQMHLMQKLGEGALPFVLSFAPTSPNSVLIKGEDGDTSPMGVIYHVRVWVGEDTGDFDGAPQTSVTMAIRKSQYVKISDQNRTPVAQGEKDFSCGGCSSAGKVSMECTLDKETYLQGEPIPVHVTINNQSNKSIKCIRLSLVQYCELTMIGEQYSTKVCKMESNDGCPIEGESNVKNSYTLKPNIVAKDLSQGTVLDGTLSKDLGDSNFASSTMSDMGEVTDASGSGVAVSYCIKITAVFATMGGEFAIDVPFKMLSPKQEIAEAVEVSDEIIDDEARKSKRLQKFDAQESVTLDSFNKSLEE